MKTDDKKLSPLGREIRGFSHLIHASKHPLKALVNASKTLF
jgi:hypothetical protein